ncbi:MAG: hypothetical protein J0L78_04100 [Planctomycetes bacterium]|nr:hypothetical protein [Planctomycetota bacterium]
MSGKSIDAIVLERDRRGLNRWLDDVFPRTEPEIQQTTSELSHLFGRLVQSDWQEGAELFAVLHSQFWRSLPRETQRIVVVEALRQSRPNTLEPLIMTVAERSVDHLHECPEIAMQWLRLCRESSTWSDYCSYAVRVPSGTRARTWLEANWIEPSVDELTALLKKFG